MTDSTGVRETVARAIAFHLGYTWGASGLDHNEFREAADAIASALRAAEERAGLMRDDIMTLGQAVGKAEARVKELEAALRPFMWGNPKYDELLWGDKPDSAPMSVTCPITLGDYRRARAALGDTPERKDPTQG
jgi:hypothetical protein